MIEESFINSARQIKNEFTKLHMLLEKYEQDVVTMANYFLAVSNEISDIKQDKNLTIESIKLKVMSKLSDIESESEKMTKRINDINFKLESLRKEELDLYKLIKKRYPSLNDDEIKIEIQKKL